ncbi:site-2 protease family protein [Nocardioides sp. zg-DK7169]|uniref:site-2 protease family protein n=1 Tax=Nocardioides sp. zg-DK7169 TaxID=2736600 RepID=UPI0034648CA9
MADHPDPPPSNAPTRSPARPTGTFKVGTVAGSDVLVSSTWFIVAALIALVLAPAVDEVQPGLGALKYVAGVAFAVVLYGSVLLHEASHAVMAKHYGFRVTSITLHFLGGMTAIEGEARTPRQEFWIAVVGPLTSIAVGLAAGALWFVVPGGLIGMAVGGLASANLLVGVLNLIPGLPLDGGRVLKAAVWQLTGNRHKGGIAAGWGGRVTAALILLWPVALEVLFGIEPQIVDFILAFIIGLFLWTGASASIATSRVRARLPRLRPRPLARRSVMVPEDLPLAEAVRRAQAAQAGGVVTVAPNGEPVGLVNEAALLAVPEERRPWVPVSSVARTLEPGLRLDADIDGEQLLAAINRTPATEYLLVEPDGSVYGVLVTADVEAAFQRAAH